MSMYENMNTHSYDNVCLCVYMYIVIYVRFLDSVTLSVYVCIYRYTHHVYMCTHRVYQS